MILLIPLADRFKLSSLQNGRRGQRRPAESPYLQPVAPVQCLTQVVIVESLYSSSDRKLTTRFTRSIPEDGAAACFSLGICKAPQWQLDGASQPGMCLQRCAPSEACPTSCPSLAQEGRVCSWMCLYVLPTASAQELEAALWVPETGQIYGTERNI